MTRKKGHMEIETFIKIINDIQQFKPEISLHHSGEPLLHPNLLEFILHARQRNLNVGITTNGTLLRGGMLDDILSTGIDTINISLSACAEVIDNVKNLAHAKNEGHFQTKIYVNIIKTRQSADDILDIQKDMMAIDGIDGFLVRGLINWSGNVDTRNMQLMKRKFIKPLIYAKRMAKLIFKKTLCESPLESAGILWDGTIVPCCFDYDAKLAVGNIMEQHFLEAYNNDKMNALRDIHRSFIKTLNHHVCGSCIFPKKYKGEGNVNS
jgi:radical SAM protein with 4Fe4S-binding SPASM domain